MKIRYFKHARDGYYFSAFVRWDNHDDILAMLTQRCSSVVDALIQTAKALEGWPPVMLVEPMGKTSKDLHFSEIKIPIQQVDHKSYKVSVKVL